jgi:hypothetical protein
MASRKFWAGKMRLLLAREWRRCKSQHGSGGQNQLFSAARQQQSAGLSLFEPERAETGQFDFSVFL